MRLSMSWPSVPALALVSGIPDRFAVILLPTSSVADRRNFLAALRKTDSEPAAYRDRPAQGERRVGRGDCRDAA
jgi:hypothetical protein